MADVYEVAGSGREVAIGEAQGQLVEGRLFSQTADMPFSRTEPSKSNFAVKSCHLLSKRPESMVDEICVVMREELRVPETARFSAFRRTIADKPQTCSRSFKCSSVPVSTLSQQPRPSSEVEASRAPADFPKVTKPDVTRENSGTIATGAVTGSLTQELHSHQPPEDGEETGRFPLF